MIPLTIVILEALPLTANGKVDRKALPAPHFDPRSLAVSYVAPATPLQEAVCALWADGLGLERVGIEDDFFDFGGHCVLVVMG